MASGEMKERIRALREQGRDRFRRDRKPLFIHRLHDDPARIVKTLEDNVGRDEFDFTG